MSIQVPRKDEGGEGEAPDPPAARAPQVEPPLADQRHWIGAALIAFGAVLLPLWDTLERQSLMSALAGSGLSSNTSVAPPFGLVGYPLLALAIAALIVRGARTAPERLGVAVLGAGLWMAYYALETADSTACTRSHAIDSWNVCEQPGKTPSGNGAYVSKSVRRPSFDGPHLENGDPCVREDEHRDVHRRLSPDGDLGDGLIQIWTRFPKDRGRVIWGTGMAVAAFAAGVRVLRRRAARTGTTA